MCKERILSRILATPKAKKAITAARLVVIDKAPTIPGRLFGRLEYVFRRTSLSTMQCRPIGGRTVLNACSLLCLSQAGDAILCACKWYRLH